MAIKHLFKYAEKQRDKLMREQQREIRALYRRAYDSINNSSKQLYRTNETLKSVYLSTLKRELINNMDNVDKQTEHIIKNNMDKMVSNVLESNQVYLSGLGYKSTINTQGMKHTVVESILTGSIYEKTYTLSSSIWGNNKQRIKEIEKIIARGIMENKSVDQIAQMLTRYVNPNVRDGSKIDYNAQRLARTTIQHAYQQAYIQATIHNPFIEAYKWITAGDHIVCPLCIERETEDKYGLGEGVFPKDKIPLDHPNGRCTIEAVVTKSDKEIAEDIADWYLGEGDPDMNEALDEFAKSLE